MIKNTQVAAMVLLAANCFMYSSSALADFEESNVPISVKALYCDGNPRIVVQFADASKNVWYPANANDASKAFMAMAIAAKISSQKLYYYGSGDPSVLTPYCIGLAARQIYMFGLN